MSPDPLNDATIVRQSLIAASSIVGRFGEPIRYYYADWTASGLARRDVEETMLEVVLPLYANTHSETSAGGRATTSLRETARASILAEVGGDERDVCLFVGSGTTAAIEKLVGMLGLFEDRDRPHIGATRACVLISSYEHHSNILIWRHKTAAAVVEISPDPDSGAFSMHNLETALRAARAEGYSPIICSLSAGSNVTGIYLDIAAVSKLAHEHGALAFFDCAAFGSHRRVQMNSPQPQVANENISGRDCPASQSSECCADAIFLSPHKFAGGPGSTGVLIAKRALLGHREPVSVGGGCVSQVQPEKTIFLSSIEAREEAGTPDILGSIRTGLVYGLKRTWDEQYRQKRNDEIVSRVFARLAGHRHINILGPSPTVARRMPIFAFTIRGLHHHFVNSLLSDLYGIQARSGCFCAQLYVSSLLDFHHIGQPEESEEVFENYQAYRIGATRFAIMWFDSDEHVDWILSSILDIAEHGWQFLPMFRLNTGTGIWSWSESSDTSANGDTNTDHRSSLMAVPASALSAKLAEGPVACASGNTVMAQLRTEREAVLYRWTNLFPLASGTQLPAQLEDYRFFAVPEEVTMIYARYHRLRSPEEDSLIGMWDDLCGRIEARVKATRKLTRTDENGPSETSNGNMQHKFVSPGTRASSLSPNNQPLLHNWTAQQPVMLPASPLPTPILKLDVKVQDPFDGLDQPDQARPRLKVANRLNTFFRNLSSRDLRRSISDS